MMACEKFFAADACRLAKNQHIVASKLAYVLFTVTGIALQYCKLFLFAGRAAKVGPNVECGQTGICMGRAAQSDANAQVLPQDSSQDISMRRLQRAVKAITD